MLTRSGNDPIPFRDPRFDPNHPLNRLPPLEEDPYAPLPKRFRDRIERERLERALEGYTPTHVLRAWEVNKYRAEKHNHVLSLRLIDGDYTPTGDPSPILKSRIAFEQRHNIRDSSSSRWPRLLYDYGDDERDATDFRTYAVETLRLGYHRFHLSNHPMELESADPPSVPPEELCWIMEYTLHECAVIRRKLARILGIYPAVCEVKGEMFDPVQEGLYFRRLHARCHRFNKRCIRPSHIELFTPEGDRLP